MTEGRSACAPRWRPCAAPSPLATIITESNRNSPVRLGPARVQPPRVYRSSASSSHFINEMCIFQYTTTTKKESFESESLSKF
ncbi:unnamed protein product [Musa banksii]